MNLFDRFWVPQADPPEPVHLLVLILLDIVLVIIYFIVYQYINYQIRRSMRGVSKDAEVIIPPNLLQSNRSIFLGVSFFVISNIISRVSFFFDVSCPESPIGYIVEDCYFLLGQEDFVNLIGIQFITIGLYNFFMELSRPLGEEMITYNPFKFSSLFILVTVFSFIILPQESQVTETVKIIIQSSFYIGLAIFIFIQMFKNRKIGKHNPLVRFRKAMTFLAFIIANLGLIILGVFFTPRPGIIYPTQLRSVEYFLSVISLISFLVVIIMVIIVFLPKPVLNLLSYDKSDLLRYWDIRFDNPLDLVGIVKEMKVDQIISYTETEYLLAYEKYEKIICDIVQPVFGGEVISFSQRTEETITKILLPNVDIIYFSAYDNRSRSSQLNRINREFGRKFSYNRGEITYLDVQKFRDPNTIYALIIIYPSIYNPNQNMWLVNFTPEIVGEMGNFFITYEKYLKSLSSQKLGGSSLISLILRFDKKNGMIMDIPSISPDKPIPDPNYVTFL